MPRESTAQAYVLLRMHEGYQLSCLVRKEQWSNAEDGLLYFDGKLEGETTHISYTTIAALLRKGQIREKCRSPFKETQQHSIEYELIRQKEEDHDENT